MKLTLLVPMFVLFIGSAAFEDGMMIPSTHASSAINEAEQKAVVFFDGHKETLIISPKFEGDASDFAWVVPVPSRPKVEIQNGALFHELETLTTPKPMVRQAADGHTMGAAKGPPPVTVLERKTVGAYDIAVLSATDAGALVKWLRTNKYRLPTKAKAPVDYYIKQKWTFVACRVKVPATSKGLRTGTLAPLKLTFAAKQPVYPMRLSSINPMPFQVLIYLVIPEKVWGTHDDRIVAVTRPQGASSYIMLSTSAAGDQRQYPTLRKVSREKLLIFQDAGMFTPSDCTMDYLWKLQAK